jgi:uncharacterized membrane protein
MPRLVNELWSERDLQEAPVRHGFRIRGSEMTRLETFTDAAFAFAVTLLVISVDDVPSSYEEFELALKSVPAFLVSFVQLIWFWLGHRKWSQLYGLDDTRSVMLSVALIAGILILVYPLRVIFSMAFSVLTDDWLPGPFTVNNEQVASIFVFYGIAFAVLSGIIVLLYAHAYGMRAKLRLNELETFDTKGHILVWCVLSGTGVVSCGIALTVPVGLAPLAGWMYTWLAIGMPLLAWYGGRRRQVLANRS